MAISPGSVEASMPRRICWRWKRRSVSCWRADPGASVPGDGVVLGAKEILLARVVAEAERGLISRGGIRVSTEPAQQVGAHRVKQVVAVEVQRVHEPQRVFRAFDFGDGHRA